LLELRELHFQLAFVAARALREDVEDQPGAVEHATFDELLEVAFLRRRQRVVEQHQFGTVLGGQRADLVRLAAADEVTRIRPVTPPADIGHRNGAGRTGQLLELLDVLGIRGCADAEAHEHGPFTCAGSLEHFC